MAQTTQQIPFQDSCRTTDADVRKAMNVLAEKEATGEHRDRREQQRYVFSMPVPMEIVLQQPGGTVSRFRVIPHNISNAGIGFLHRAFVHQQTSCQIRLVTLAGDAVILKGKTTHSACLHGRIHIIGVRFEHPIDAVDFVTLTRADDEDQVPDSELAMKVAKELGKLVLANVTISELRAKYDELGRVLFEGKA